MSSAAWASYRPSMAQDICQGSGAATSAPRRHLGQRGRFTAAVAGAPKGTEVQVLDVRAHGFELFCEQKNGQKLWVSSRLVDCSSTAEADAATASSSSCASAVQAGNGQHCHKFSDQRANTFIPSDEILHSLKVVEEHLRTNRSLRMKTVRPYLAVPAGTTIKVREVCKASPFRVMLRCSFYDLDQKAWERMVPVDLLLPPEPLLDANGSLLPELELDAKAPITMAALKQLLFERGQFARTELENVWKVRIIDVGANYICCDAGGIASWVPVELVPGVIADSEQLKEGCQPVEHSCSAAATSEEEAFVLMPYGVADEKDAGEMNTFHNYVTQKIGVLTSNQIVRASNVGNEWSCQLDWIGHDTVTAAGPSKKIARARAALVMLRKHRPLWRALAPDGMASAGLPQNIMGKSSPLNAKETNFCGPDQANIDPEHQIAVNQIRHSLVSATRGECSEELVDQGVALAERSPPEVWGLFLPELFEALVTSAGDGAASFKVKQLLHRLSKIPIGSLLLGTWERLLDIAAACSNMSIASDSLRFFLHTGCASDSFATQRTAVIFQRFRVWLAREGQAEIRQALDGFGSSGSSDAFDMQVDQLDSCTGRIVLSADAHWKVDLVNERDLIVLSCWSTGHRALGRVVLAKAAEKLLQRQLITVQLEASVDERWWHTAEQDRRVQAITLVALGVPHQRMTAALRGASVCSDLGLSSYLRTLLFSMDVGDLGCVDTASDILDNVAGPYVDPNAVCTTGLTEMQSHMLHLAFQQRVTLIQGPPGTGKSSTAVRIVQAWRNEPKLKGKILCCADSNAAADHLTQALLASGVSCLRMGRWADYEKMDRMRRFPAYSKYVQAKSQHNHGQEIYQKMRLEKQALEEFGIVVCTCSTSGHESLQGVNFPYLVIDECTQAVLPSTLVPLGLGAERVVLLGDHRQLPPTVLDSESAREGFDRSLFERLIVARPEWAGLLNLQFRMSPSIAEFPSREFYDNRVKSDASCSSLPPVGGLAWPAENVRVLCVNVFGWEDYNGSSLRNSAEADAIVKLLPKVRLQQDEIGVVTPYQSQKSLLKRKLRDAGYGNVVVDTVDGFQGSERELIILSVVRCNTAGKIGFVSDVRRMNVALTRARRGVVVFASTSTLADVASGPARSDERCCDRSSWSRWLAWVRAAGAIVSNVEEAFAPGAAEPHPSADLLTPRADAMVAEAVRAVAAAGKLSAANVLPFTRRRLSENGVSNSQQLVDVVSRCTEEAWSTRFELPFQLLQEMQSRCFQSTAASSAAAEDEYVEV